MAYIALGVVFVWISMVGSQNSTAGNSELLTMTTNNSSSTLTTATTMIVPREILTRRLPSPTGLEKLAATTSTLILRFRPPSNYAKDGRYTHFRIEYENDVAKQSIELDKTSLNPNRIILPGLLSGVLYRISVRSQGRDAIGNYLLSPIYSTIKARTVPPPASNLRIIPAFEGRPTEMIVAWDGSPTPPTGPKYDLFTLSYRIVDKLTSTQAFRYRKQPIEVPHKPTSAFTVASVKNITRRVNVELGATYTFTVVTRSLGEDTTKSLPLQIKYKIPFPGPATIRKVEHDSTWLSVEWTLYENVIGITDYVLMYRAIPTNEVKTKLKNITVSGDVNRYNFTDLNPGVLYHISVKCRRNNVPFGYESDEKTLYARTAPPSPNIIIGQINMSYITMGLKPIEKGAASAINVQYELLREERQFPSTSYNVGTKDIIIPSLIPGELYRITATVVSKEPIQVDETMSLRSILVRTLPSPPKSFKGSGKQGKILLNWVKPDELKAPTYWRYEIVYYPVDLPNRISRISVWNRDGANQMTHSLDRLLPGTLYEILLYCEVGKDTKDNRLARSVPAGGLRLYTQPQNPVITSWSQVSLSRVKLQWTPPGQSVANFDYYLLNLTRLYSSDSAIGFKPEYLSYVIRKHDTEKILKLSFGSTYRVVLTAVVGQGDTWMESVVNTSNSKLIETWSPYDSHQVFARSVWKFTSCGQLGRFGPNQVLCDYEYEDTTLNKLVTLEEGMQYWMAPIEGLYRITATGAGYEGPGGKGATVSGLFHLAEGTKLKIAVGQQGDYDGDMTQGGSGGTFVVSPEGGDEPLVVAGGAGTAFATATPSPISNGRLNHSAGDASSVGQGFGHAGDLQTLGPGMPGTSNTAGGAGLRGVSRSAVNFGDVVFPAAGFLPFDDEQNIEANDTEQLVIIPLAGGRYETENGDYSEGGFGGGGSGYKTAAGGGGGYTGGGGGPSNGYSGGGGSYIKFTGGTQYAEVVNNEAGHVKITLVGLPVSTPIPVSLYLIVAFLVGIGMTSCFGGLLCWVDRCAGRRIKGGKLEKDQTSPNQPTTTDLYDTSVHVTDTSPSMSGLYVRNVDEADNMNYRKYSEVDSEVHMPRPVAHVIAAPRLAESDESDTDYDQREFKNHFAGYEDTNLESGEEPDSESTPSSVSSYKSDIDKITADVYAWDITKETSERGSSESTDSSDEGHETEEGSEVSTLPPPPPPPPLEGLVGAERKENFRRLQKFHSMENSMF